MQLHLKESIVFCILQVVLNRIHQKRVGGFSKHSFSYLFTVYSLPWPLAYKAGSHRFPHAVHLLGQGLILPGLDALGEASLSHCSKPRAIAQAPAQVWGAAGMI